MYMNMAFDNVCFKGSAVSTSARFVYLCLCKHADNTKQTCFPSLNRIAQIVGKSISTIKRAVRELCKYGVIERTARFRKDGGQTSNLYTIVACELDALTKAPESESHTQPEIPDHDVSLDDISSSVSDPESEQACSCTSEANAIEQNKAVEGITEIINIKIENTSLSQGNSAAAETEKIHIYAEQADQENKNASSNLQVSQISQVLENQNTGIKPDKVSTLKASGIKEKLWRFLKAIGILAVKTDFFIKNELGGGHR